MTTLLEVSLDDKYIATSGRVFMSGIQALVRLPMDQRRLDQARGWSTAGYVTGYRGSPLGTYDQQLTRAKKHLTALGVLHQPGVNEDLAATACQGTQQVGLDGNAAVEGVFAIWYGKGPGVDRSGDAFRHGNLFGTTGKGGVLLLLGDDHICESSTTAHQSEYAMVDAMVPILNPSGVQEILEYGLAGIAMSRYAGLWVSLKCIHDTVESTASVLLDPRRTDFAEPHPDFLPRSGGLGLVMPPDTPWPPMALENERRLHVEKLAAAKAWARANRLDRVVLGGTDQDRLLVVTLGKSWQDVVAALDELGIDEARARALGLRVYKPAMAWPLEPEALREAAAGVETILVIEEKRPLVEGQIRELLYDAPTRPKVVGKTDEAGRPLFPSWGSLDVTMIALELARRLAGTSGDPDLEARVADLEARAAAAAAVQPGFVRLPWYCPGCPHNTSTKVPDGSRAVAGIGCHFMVTWMGRNTQGFTQMGGEGASWLGEAPFTNTPHVFQNIGDGTFYHSGSLAIRAAKAAGANITFKILYNDAVAMTGGQKMETANLSVPQIAKLLEAEGVEHIAVVADEPERYPMAAGLPGGAVIHRDELDAVQRRMREKPGVSAIIYDQTCAAEKRRRRKHGEFPDPDERVIINELVCEGCGDCGVQSSCVAIQPAETAFGRKRRIDQSACNKDFSCLKGFCPSFVSVKGGKLKKAAIDASAVPFPVLPEPMLPALDGPYPMVVTGIGGTGVITIAALLGMAAHLEGKGFVALDMVGLAQKGGAVVTTMKLAPTPEATGSPRVGAGTARLLLGCDMVVAAGKTALPTVRKGLTRVVANLEETMTGAFTRDPDLAYPTERLRRDLEAAAGPRAVDLLDASRLAAKLVGDAIGANLMMVGFAWQKGLIPLSAAAIDRAIELNGVAVGLNRAAFLWGRRAAHDLPAVQRIAGLGERKPKAKSLDGLVDERAAFLAGYQDEAWALRYRRAIDEVRAAEGRAVPGSTRLAEAAARGLFKLMSYKDEYEVARLWTDGSFDRQIEAEFESWDRLELHLAPPMITERDARTGHLKKRRFGPWMLKAFRYLAPLKRLRGTWLDPFGRTAERRTERRLIALQETLLRDLAAGLRPENHEAAVALAALPLDIRGFGHVKEANLEKAKARQAELMAAFKAPPPRPALPAAA